MKTLIVGYTLQPLVYDQPAKVEESSEDAIPAADGCPEPCKFAPWTTTFQRVALTSKDGQMFEIDSRHRPLLSEDPEAKPPVSAKIRRVMSDLGFDPVAGAKTLRVIGFGLRGFKFLVGTESCLNLRGCRPFPGNYWAEQSLELLDLGEFCQIATEELRNPLRWEPVVRHLSLGREEASRKRLESWGGPGKDAAADLRIATWIAAHFYLL